MNAVLVTNPPSLSGNVYVEKATDVTTAGALFWPSSPPPLSPPSLGGVGVGSGAVSSSVVVVVGRTGARVVGSVVVVSDVSDVSEVVVDVCEAGVLDEDDGGEGGGVEDVVLEVVEVVVVIEDDEVDVLELLLNGAEVVDSRTVSVCIVKMISDSAVVLCANAGPASRSNTATMTLSSELILRGIIVLVGQSG